MAENNPAQKDLVECFGSQGIASEVLSGKREISKTKAKSLVKWFVIAPALFL
jgi:HTH-type transcriptional regulator/antitoxin HigA